MKEEIKSHHFTTKRGTTSYLITKSGKLNTNYFKDGKNQDLKSSIENKTKFLDKNSCMAEKIYCIVNGISDVKTCGCGSKLEFINFTKGYYTFCGGKCDYNIDNNLIKMKKTNMQRYGVEHNSQIVGAQEKIKERNLTKYGETHAMKLTAFVTKAKTTKLNRYGDENYNNKTASAKTKFDRYGDENYNNKDKTKHTCLERYGVENPFQSKEFQDKTKQTLGKPNVNSLEPHIQKKMDSYTWLYNEYKTKKRTSCDISQELGINNTTIIDYLHKHGISINTHYNTSMGQRELTDYIKSLGITVLENDRTHGKEIDIFLPDLKIGFEYNGLYYHSENFVCTNYHKDKIEYFKEIGVRVYMIWEHEWQKKKDIVKNFIAYKCGVISERVFARKCIPYTPTKKERNLFLDKHHIQGTVKSTFDYGLKYEGELVALLCMDGDLLTRYCTSMHVVGGFTRLLSKVKNENIITFADRCVSDGNVYHKAGFVFDKELPPDYKYLVDNELKHKFGFRKKRFETDINLEYACDMTEKELAKLNGLVRVYDAGKIRFALQNKL